MEKQINFLRSVNQLNIKRRREKTYLEVANVNSKENVWTSILSYFCDPQNNHVYGNSFVKAITKSINVDYESVQDELIEVKSEYFTNKGNRIDIVIRTGKYIIGIENKVHAYIYNDLEDYADTIDMIALSENLKPLKILLTIEKHSLSIGSFVNLEYKTLLKQIKMETKHIENSDWKLNDFIRTIENTINKTGEYDIDKDIIDSFIQNRELVFKIVKMNDMINNELSKKLLDIEKYIDREAIRSYILKDKSIINFEGHNKSKASGYFVYENQPLLKYSVTIKGVSFWYEVSFENYSIYTAYWQNKETHDGIIDKAYKIIGEGKTFEMQEDSEMIAKEIEKEIIAIVITISNLYTPSH
jgi:hypothetical protein